MTSKKTQGPLLLDPLPAEADAPVLRQRREATETVGRLASAICQVCQQVWFDERRLPRRRRLPGGVAGDRRPVKVPEIGQVEGRGDGPHVRDRYTPVIGEGHGGAAVARK